ncbi:MAG: hypothetical protein HZA36_00450 [Parcubacteria group bacterium]|nr:hypothetical protein [Parcubacteria group bacterium]
MSHNILVNPVRNSEGSQRKISNGVKQFGFDMDGVIIDHTEMKMRLAKELGFDLKPEETPAEVIRNIIPGDQLDILKRRLYDDPITGLLSGVMPGAKEALREITASQTPLFLISRRKNPTMAIELLRVHGLWPTFFNEGNAFFVNEPKEKNERARHLGVTHYTDDERDVLRVVEVSHSFLFDHLGVFKEDEAYVHVQTWPSLLSFLLQ